MILRYQKKIVSTCSQSEGRKCVSVCACMCMCVCVCVCVCVCLSVSVFKCVGAYV